MKRVAVCISGQLRTWQYCVDNILKFFQSNNDFEFDFFLHTWDSSEIRRKDDEFICSMEQHNDLEFTQLKEAYKPKSILIEKPITDHFDYIYKTRWTNLFYSLRKAILLKEKYEQEHKFTYDIVVKTRYDLIFNPMLPAFSPTKIIPRTIYTTSDEHVAFEHYNRNVNDLFFFGDSPTMDMISHLSYLQAIKHGTMSPVISPIHPIVKGLGPGAIMDVVCRQYNVQSSNLRAWNVQEAIVRSNAILHAPFIRAEDFNNAIELHYAFYK